VGSLARSYARMLSVPVPQPDSGLVSLLQEAHVSQFVPKNKTIIVDESLTKEDEQGKDLIFTRVKDSSTEYFFTLVYGQIIPLCFKNSLVY
jgi:hypothetical protein